MARRKKMTGFFEKHFDGAKWWQVLLICGTWAGMFLAIIAKL